MTLHRVFEYVYQLRIHVAIVVGNIQGMDPLVFKQSGIFGLQAIQVLRSMTKMMSAQRMSAGPMCLRALGLVPAERTLKPGRRRQIASAVGLRHWLRLQTNRRFVTLDPTVGECC